MELRHLRYFVGVAEALSFTKAAEKLHTAQPSLTRQIKDLEEELGVRLLNRTKQQVTPDRRGPLISRRRQTPSCSRSRNGRVRPAIAQRRGSRAQYRVRQQSLLRFAAEDSRFVPSIVSHCFG